MRGTKVEKEIVEISAVEVANFCDDVLGLLFNEKINERYHVLIAIVGCHCLSETIAKK